MIKKEVTREKKYEGSNIVVLCGLENEIRQNMENVTQ
jgi:hypothetical protein